MKHYLERRAELLGPGRVRKVRAPVARAVWRREISASSREARNRTAARRLGRALGL